MPKRIVKSLAFGAAVACVWLAAWLAVEFLVVDPYLHPSKPCLAEPPAARPGSDGFTADTSVTVCDEVTTAIASPYPSRLSCSS
jgi:hypothetical protein